MFNSQYPKERSKMDKSKEVEIITSDAGGTMTDIFVVDRHGDFVIGMRLITGVLIGMKKQRIFCLMWKPVYIQVLPC
jgi:hypothetical protein